MKNESSNQSKWDERKADILIALIRHDCYDEDHTITRSELLEELNHSPKNKHISMRALDNHLSGKVGNKNKGLVSSKIVISSFKGLYLAVPDTLERMARLLEILTTAVEMVKGHEGNVGEIINDNLSGSFLNCYNSVFGNKLIRNIHNLYPASEPDILDASDKSLKMEDLFTRWEQISREKSIIERMSYVIAVMHINKIINSRLCGSPSSKISGKTARDPECALHNLTLSFSGKDAIEDRVRYIFNNESGIVKEFFGDFVISPIRSNWQVKPFHLFETFIVIQNDDNCFGTYRKIIESGSEIVKLLRRVPIPIPEGSKRRK